MKKRVSAYLAIGLFITLSIGCANKSLDALKDLEQKNQEGLVAMYDEALERQHIERKSVEDQFIDLQSKHAYIVNAYIRETNITPNDIENRKVFSFSEIQKHEDEFEKTRDKRWSEIDTSYSDLKKTIKEKKELNLEEEIKRIEGEREETGNIFFSGLKKIVEIFGDIF